MEEEAPRFADVLNVFYLTSRSIDDALAESITGEIVLFIATCESPFVRCPLSSARVPPLGRSVKSVERLLFRV